MTATLPPITEAQWQAQVTELATLLGWQWCHFRPAQTSHGWRTPVSGPIGAGMVDLILVQPNARRLLFVELKRDGAKLRPDQERVHDVLRLAGADVRVWHPADWPEVTETLR